MRLLSQVFSLIVVSSILTAVGLRADQGKPDAHTTAPNFVTYKDTDHFFSIDHPVDWEQKAIDKPPIAVQFISKGPAVARVFPPAQARDGQARLTRLGRRN